MQGPIIIISMVMIIFKPIIMISIRMTLFGIEGQPVDVIRRRSAGYSDDVVASQWDRLLLHLVIISMMGMLVMLCNDFCQCNTLSRRMV